MGIPFQQVHCLRQVACRIEYHTVRNGKSPLERKIGKIVHEPFKDKYRVIHPVSVLPSDAGNVLRGYGPLEIWVTEFDASASASEPDREILSAPYAVVYLHAFPRCDIRRNPPFCEVLQQYVVAKRRYAQVLKCRSFRRRFPLRGYRYENRTAFSYLFQERGIFGCPVQPLCKVNDTASFSFAKINSQIF